MPRVSHVPGWPDRRKNADAGKAGGTLFREVMEMGEAGNEKQKEISYVVGERTRLYPIFSGRMNISARMRPVENFLKRARSLEYDSQEYQILRDAAYEVIKTLNNEQLSVLGG